MKQSLPSQITCRFLHPSRRCVYLYCVSWRDYATRTKYNICTKVCVEDGFLSATSNAKRCTGERNRDAHVAPGLPYKISHAIDFLYKFSEVFPLICTAAE